MKDLGIEWLLAAAEGLGVETMRHAVRVATATLWRHPRADCRINDRPSEPEALLCLDFLHGHSPVLVLCRGVLDRRLGAGGSDPGDVGPGRGCAFRWPSLDRTQNLV